MNQFKKYLCLLYFFSCTAIAAPEIREIQSPYDISASTVQEIRQQMSANGVDDRGQRFDAHTDWHVKWLYDYQDGPEGCYMTNIAVSVDITYHLPRWTNYDAGDSGLQNQWNTYMEHLLAHERGHAEHGVNAATEVEETLQNLPRVKDCTEMGATAHAATKQIIEKYSTQDIDYDRETNHGMTQGAVFP